MKVRALRGVCIGVERHLVAGEFADLEAATVQFLSSIGAVEIVPDEPHKEPEKESEKKSIEAEAPHERSKSAKGKG